MPKKIFTLLCIYSIPLFALPEGAFVKNGTVDTTALSGNALQVTASDRSIIDWNHFSIGRSETVRFIQPSSDAAVLNRVMKGAKSEIWGSLTANGRVYLINPRGILIGPDALIDTSSFIASTLPVSENAFLANRELLFAGNSQEGIINLGTIQTEAEVYLFAHRVENKGSIHAQKGNVALLAGHEIVLQPASNPVLRITPDLQGMGVELQGTIEALQVQVESANAHAMGIRQEKSGTICLVQEGGKVLLRTQGALIDQAGEISAPNGTVLIATQSQSDNSMGAIRQAGTIDVSGTQGGHIDIVARKCLQTGTLVAEGGDISIQTEGPYIATAQASLSAKGGSIRVHALEKGTIFTSGKYDVGGPNGGQISLTGSNVSLVGTKIHADGKEQGGKVSIGGGLQGKEASIPNAESTYISPSTIISANGVTGGTITVWSDGKTEQQGMLTATGMKGFIEVSGKDCVVGGGKAEAEQVLLDPDNLIIDATQGIFPQYPFNDPNPGAPDFGTALPLSTGNVVVANPQDNFYATDGGVVYLYNGLTAELISALHGFFANDNVGQAQYALTNGNVVSATTNWNSQMGAVTLINGTTGLSGIVSAANSLVGSTEFDSIGTSITPLTNGNYVVFSPDWNSSEGATTWGSGTQGVTGTISSTNSLLGTDYFSSSVLALPNGNYVIATPDWNGSIGAVTWGNGTSGVTGTISRSNSLIGETSGDSVGSNGVTILKPYSNYVVLSPNWNNSTGAATWGNGTTGITGTISTLNSLTGASGFSEEVGQSAILLSNGNYVVSSPEWGASIGMSDMGAVTWVNGANGFPFGSSGPGVGVSQSNSLTGDAAFAFFPSNLVALDNGNFVAGGQNWNGGIGAATWSNGSIVGTQSAANSLIGSTSGDFSSANIIALPVTNNYIVLTPSWNGGLGAVTWGNGATGIIGTISATISLVGSHLGDNVGGGSSAALANGNYVVSSPDWNDDAGAATWGNGTTGITGSVSSNNSLVGSTMTSYPVASQGGVTLTNGNYVVISPTWNNSIGAVTFGSGSTGVTGYISTQNSLTGTAQNDRVGLGGVLSLTNGNYVVLSRSWSSGRGAATFVNGSTGNPANASSPGVTVSSINSLVGSSTSDSVGSSGGLALTNGNYVVLSPSWHTRFGAATWGSGTTGITGTISSSNSLIGNSTGSEVGSGIGLALTNGHYVIFSPLWNTNQYGAATWGNGATGITGTVSNLNSLIGSFNGDEVSSNGGIALTNGNYVVFSPGWAPNSFGAATWVNGSNGWPSGGSSPGATVSAVNSLIGSNTSTSDSVGSSGGLALQNGNYVVFSPNWNGNVGAATWGNGSVTAMGITGTVTITNSLTGTTSFDSVGSLKGIALTDPVNGSYVVLSPSWSNRIGAATWVNGSNGYPSGASQPGVIVSPTNSLVGSNANDEVGSAAIALSNGNYVVLSSSWNSSRGAATWGNGSVSVMGITGTVTSTNSLVGTNPSDTVGSNAIALVGNGNYVIFSPSWNSNAGAATFGNGASGITGSISSVNSLIGHSGDQVGSNQGLALLNGNYVVFSPDWNSNVGAGTWGNGATGITGTVSTANSLVGSSTGDFVASNKGIALTNGDYVVFSPLWASDQGAATWGNGATGITGTVNSTNSILASTPDSLSEVSSLKGIALTNNNFVVFSPDWTYASGTNLGAATFGTGASPGTSGYITSSNSLIGSEGDQISSMGAVEIVALPNGNYVVSSPSWNGAIGAATFGNGAKGVTGFVSYSNSLTGSQNGDFIGSEGIQVLPNSNYVVESPEWDATAGAITWVNGETGIPSQASSIGAVVSSANSMVGISSGSTLALSNGNFVFSNNSAPGTTIWGNGATGEYICGGTGSPNAQNAIFTDNSPTVVEDKVNGTFIVYAPSTSAGGNVIAGLQNPNQLTFSRGGSDNFTLAPCFLTTTLNAGSALTIQANSNITVNSPILTNPGSGSLTMQANGTIALNADVQIQNALTLIAGVNIEAANGVVIFGTNVNLVVDNNFPKPTIGTGAFILPGATIAASDSLRLYAGAFGLSQFPPVINSVPYHPGQLTFESYGVWYPSTGSFPYHVFYKTGASEVPLAIQEYFSAVSEPFQQWSAQWADQFLFDCKYLFVPFRDLFIVPYSLVTQCPCCCKITSTQYNHDCEEQ